MNPNCDLGYPGDRVPHWNCERCGARLYSASRHLKRGTCPTCDGRLVAVEDPPARFDREGSGNRPGAVPTRGR